MDDSEETPLINTSTSVAAMTTVTTGTVSTAKPTVPYRRSVSLPATQIQSKVGGAREKLTCVVESDCSRSKTDPMMSSSSQGALGDGGGREGEPLSTTDKNITSSENISEGVSPLGQGADPIVPKVFDFYRSDGGEEEEMVGGCEGVFMFTASPSKTGEPGDEVRSKPVRGESCEGVRAESCEGVREGEGEGHNEVVVELAQQLQLDSDNVSIHTCIYTHKNTPRTHRTQFMVILMLKPREKSSTPYRHTATRNPGCPIG